MGLRCFLKTETVVRAAIRNEREAKDRNMRGTFKLDMQIRGRE